MMDKASILKQLECLEQTLAKAQTEVAELVQAVAGEDVGPVALAEFIKELESNDGLQTAWKANPVNVISGSALSPADKIALQNAVSSLDGRLAAEGASNLVVYVRTWQKPSPPGT
jgi:hypothetical protein